MANAALPTSSSLAATAAAPAFAPGRPAQKSAGGTGKDSAEEQSAAAGASVEAALQHLTSVLRSASVSVQFEIDSATHRVITKVTDKSTGEVIRQIPTEEVVRIADAMAQLQGLFVRQTA